MTTNFSFSKFENEIMHEMRNRINHIEHRVDLENLFSYMAVEFLLKVFSDIEISLAPEDITFNPDNAQHYTIHERLLHIESFQELWKNSDISKTIHKLADMTYTHLLHISKHTEKTRKKLRN